jgi:hypothetical protein
MPSVTSRLTTDTGDDRGQARQAPQAPEPADAVLPAAAPLDAGLDQLLTEHVDLTADVVQTAVTTRASSAATRAALAAVDQNTRGLGNVLGSVYGPAAHERFLKLWRAHIGFFIDYALGVSMHDPAKVAKANKDLAGYITQFSAFVSGTTRLSRSAAAADLRGHVSTLKAAVNAVVTGRPDAGVKIELAAMHMHGTAAVLARGIASPRESTAALPARGTPAGARLSQA